MEIKHKVRLEIEGKVVFGHGRSSLPGTLWNYTASTDPAVFCELLSVNL